MAMKKLPCDIQSLFCAKTQICSYKRAVEELVYNSLDAESTSIAVRVNIEQNTIQVIDNGCGVSKCNFSLIGHRHATSKCVDLSTLKSVPNKYGYRGQSLASIIEVSQTMNITSRCQNSEETWVKKIHKGKEKKLNQASQRPSKGTTVEVQGFLYNLKIQKKAIDSITELNDIKSFLEQLSLVHNNVSMSLRDDTRNEIIFKLHKNRDIYQTLASIFAIDRKDVEELKVEKNQYKVSAFIGKRDKDIIQNQNNWVYLNGKYLQNSKVQKIVNDKLMKFLKWNAQSNGKVKSKNPYNHEGEIKSKSGLPFYFIFITCPYYDYDINYASKQTVVEFKNWEPLNKLIEKMAKFYAGHIDLKEINPNKIPKENLNKVDDTRDQVKKIMEKILGSNPKKIAVSQMQNGIKGKITKRKSRKKVDKISIQKILPIENKSKSEITNAKKHNDQKPLHCNTNENPKETKTSKTVPIKTKNLKCKRGKIANKNKLSKKTDREVIENNHKEKDKIVNDSKSANIEGKRPKNTKAVVSEKRYKRCLEENKNLKKQSEPTKNLQKANIFRIDKNEENQNFKTDPLLKVFKDPTGSVQKRCNLLANKVENLIRYKSKRKRKIFINETVQYSNITRDNKIYSVHKKIGEIIIHDFIPKPTGLSPCTFDNRVWDKNMKKLHKSSYDLVKTILTTQETRNFYTDEINVTNDDENGSPEVPTNDTSSHFYKENSIPKNTDKDRIDDTPSIPHLPKLTFESHNYVEKNNRTSNNYYEEGNAPENVQENVLNKRFITTQSKDNFVIPTLKPKPKKFTSKIKHMEFESNKMHTFSKRFECHEKSSYIIDFTKTKENNHLNDKSTEFKNICVPFDLDGTNENIALNIERNDKMDEDSDSQNFLTYTINRLSVNENVNNDEGRHSKDIKNLDYIKDSIERTSCFSYCQSNQNVLLWENENFNYTDKNHNDNNLNVVFITNSQEQQTNDNQSTTNHTSFNNQIDPLNIYETVNSQDEFEEHKTNRKMWNDSLFNDEFYVNSFLCDRNAYTEQSFYEPMATVTNDVLIEPSINFDAINGNCQERGDVDEPVINERELFNIASDFQEDAQHKCSFIDIMKSNNLLSNKHGNITDHANNFSFKNRSRFVPKGMSQIFAKCQTRNVCNYNLENDYYEEAIYNNFADNVQSKYEIFEPGVQNVKEFSTKAIEKLSTKVNKDNASLIFNGDALKQAKVLRQIDNKFIAAKIEGRTNQSKEEAETLVLFDQHAVHERIRLESNLSAYFNGTVWKSMPLDNIILKLSKEETLYLHNFADKFSQLGLEWTILTNSEVAFKAIPEAILGKNPRQVEIVMKAVKSLIVEEINAIKCQSGCISLYPKSIMDLVFSEACRYAIKFGESLSKQECEDLLNSLSECKTPFQCAHGRPVMAVLMDIKRDSNKYKINTSNVQKWLNQKKQVKKK